jgi:plastocyanin
MSSKRFVTALGCVVCVTCGAAPLAAQSVTGLVALTGADGKPPKKPDYAGIVVWLEPTAGSKPTVASAPKAAVMAQRNKTFMPHLIAIEVGTAVDFPNDDPGFHNVFSNYDGQIFDVQVYAPRESRRVVFRRAGVVHVFCNIHETMNAIVAVLPTPYFAVTLADGRFQIRAPAGQYRVHLWHERVEPDVAARVERTITVTAADTALPETTLTMSDRPIGPHLNKYGQGYAFSPGDSVFYPGARR